MDSQEKEVLQLLEGDVKSMGEMLRETITDIIAEGYSDYPILIAHEEDISIATKVIEKNLYKTSFNFSASTLEELIEKKVIKEDKRAAFEAQIKVAKDKVCILLLHSDVMKFVFSPLK